MKQINYLLLILFTISITGALSLQAAYTHQAIYRCKGSPASYMAAIKPCRYGCSKEAATRFAKIEGCGPGLNRVLYRSFADQQARGGVYPCDKYFKFINESEAPHVICSGKDNVGSITIIGDYNHSLSYPK
jgi:hypothetical protein